MANKKENKKEETKTVNRKKMRGTVVSNKNEKTLVVKVNRLIEHPIYKKRFTKSKRYKAHYEEGEYSVGDKVVIEETKPISKDKRWRVINKV